MAMIKDNIARIKEDISLTCRKLGRNPDDITIVGVTKMTALDMINEAIAGGITHIGENKVQEALSKFPLLNTQGITRHMIGHLQTNKVKDALKLFDVIQSVDSLRLAQTLERHAAEQNRTIDILIEVNASGERQKYGIAPEETHQLIDAIACLDHIRIAGLMTMAPFVDDEKTIRNCFRILRMLYDNTARRYQGNQRVVMQYLSMGMTADYRIALEEGSNMVRIGRAIFSNG